MGAVDSLSVLAHQSWELIRNAPLHLLISIIATTFFLLIVAVYFILFIVAPVPRPPRPSEKTYKTVLPDGSTSKDTQLPCWYDKWYAQKELAREQRKNHQTPCVIEEPEIFMSVVVPAYNEEERLGGMLEEAVDFLQGEYGDAHGSEVEVKSLSTSASAQQPNGHVLSSNDPSCSKLRRSGWEIVIVSDGSTDKTVQTALKFAQDHQLSQYPNRVPGPWKIKPEHNTHIPHGSIRVVMLEQNRGKGGAVTHGMRHVRGEYIVFADADGASKFDDLGKLVQACREIEDAKGRGIAIGSRSHLVASPAVVKRSKLRNFLMHSFHLLLRFMTPPATSAIKDTQCGFKLFSRSSLPDIIPYMHCEGWIFDVEMLMLAESAGIKMTEVAIGWKEVKGSKLNVIWDSLGMAWGLAVLRASWLLGVYRRD